MDMVIRRGIITMPVDFEDLKAGDLVKNVGQPYTCATDALQEDGKRFVVDTAGNRHYEDEPEADADMRDWKIQNLTVMRDAELAARPDERYGAHLSHWSGRAQDINIDSGALQTLIDYYTRKSTEWESVSDNYNIYMRKLGARRYEYVATAAKIASPGGAVFMHGVLFLDDWFVQGAVERLNRLLDDMGFASYEEFVGEVGEDNVDDSLASFVVDDMLCERLSAMPPEGEISVETALKLLKNITGIDLKGA